MLLVVRLARKEAEGTAERRVGATEVIFVAWTLRDGLGCAWDVATGWDMQVSGLDFGENKRCQ